MAHKSGRAATVLESLEGVSFRFCQLLRGVRTSNARNNARAVLLELLARETRLIAQKQNASNALLALPHAVLQMICQLVGPTDCAVLARTCYALRCYMLGNPLVWNHLDDPCSFMAPARRTLALAERGAAAGLRAFNLILAGGSDDTLARVESLLPWICDAQFFIAPCAGDFAKQMKDVHPLIWQQITRPLLAPAPRLEKLGLYACRHCYKDPLELPTDIFASCPPDGLRHCMLLGITFPAVICPAFSRLEFLEYTLDEMEAPAFATLLGNLPSLVSLRLGVSNFKLREGVDLDTLRFEEYSLRNLHLSSCPRPGFDGIMACVRRLPIVRLVVSSDVWLYPQDALKTFPPGTRAQLGATLSEFSSWAALDGPSMPVRFVSKPRDLCRLMRTDGVFSLLTSLALHEFLWFPSSSAGDHSPPAPEVPLLRDLRILLASPREHRIPMPFGSRDAVSVLVRRFQWHLPSLSTLHLSFRPCIGVPVLFMALSDVHAFVVNCITPAPPSSLELSGVEVVDLDAHVWLARLHNLVGSTSVSAQPAQACVADARLRTSTDLEAVFLDDIGTVL